MIYFAEMLSYLSEGQRELGKQTNHRTHVYLFVPDSAVDQQKLEKNIGRMSLICEASFSAENGSISKAKFQSALRQIRATKAQTSKGMIYKITCLQLSLLQSQKNYVNINQITLPFPLPLNLYRIEWNQMSSSSHRPTVGLVSNL